MAKRTTIGSLLAVSLAASAAAGQTSAASGGTPEADRSSAAATASPVRLDISYRMSPRFTRALHMGDRWVSPPTFVHREPGRTLTVEARVRGYDAAGGGVEIRPLWAPSDPEMITVTPAERSSVSIAVHRSGEGLLKVSAGGIVRELIVRASREQEAMRVEIHQVPPQGAPGAEQRARILEARAAGTSYAVGVDLGRRLMQEPLEWDAALVAQGLRDALGRGNTLLTEDELQTGLAVFRRSAEARRMQEQAAMARKRGEVAEGRLAIAERSRQQGLAFLAENRVRPGVVTLDSGLQYRILEAGEGPRPSADATVVCHYRGTLVDGTEFDSSYRRQGPGTFALPRVIRGWREALPLMAVGSRWQLVVPPELAYGARGTRTIAPNSTLVFEVELLGIEPVSRARAAAPAVAGGRP